MTHQFIDCGHNTNTNNKYIAITMDAYATRPLHRCTTANAKTTLITSNFPKPGKMTYHTVNQKQYSVRIDYMTIAKVPQTAILFI